jgi:hypothetical protein
MLLASILKSGFAHPLDGISYVVCRLGIIVVRACWQSADAALHTWQPGFIGFNAHMR